MTTPIEEMLPDYDFSSGRPIRRNLRRQLLTAYDQRHGARLNRMRWATGLIALTAALALLIATSSEAVAQSAANILNAISVGNRSQIEVVDGDFMVVEGQDGSRVIERAEGDIELPIEDDYSFVEEPPASLPTGFELQMPSYIPDGFTLDRTDGNTDEGLLTYTDGRGGLIGIREVYGRGIQVTTSADLPIETVQIGSAEGALTTVSRSEFHLLWEVGEISYELTTMGIFREDVLRIAESLR